MRSIRGAVALAALLAAPLACPADEPVAEATPATTPTPPPPVEIARTNIRLTPPPGFVPATTFDGLMKEDDQASIMVVTFAVGFNQAVADIVDEETLTRKKLTIVKKEMTSIRGRTAFVADMTQVVADIPFQRINVLFGDDKDSVLIVANFPQAKRATLEAPIRAALLDAEWLRIGDTAAFGARPFELTPSADLKRASFIRESQLFTTNAVYPRVDVRTALYVAGPSLNNAQGILPEDQCEHSIRKLPMAVVSQITSTRQVEIDGLDGIEMIANARDPDTTHELLVYQVILFEQSMAWVFHGITVVEDREKNLAAFKAMTESFKRR